MNTCEVCNKEFGGRKKKYCSLECKRERYETVRRGPKWEVTCEARDCSEKFMTRHEDQRFCSPKCRSRESGRRKSAALKKHLFEIYGGVCSCPNCNEHREEFLTLEHIHGDGREHRESTSGAYGSWQDAIENPDPTRFKVMCMNCNFARGKY